jgi:hypothetical protein
MSTFQQLNPHLNLHAIEVLEEVQHNLQAEYDSRRYMNDLARRQWEQKVAGDVMLLREIFREKGPVQNGTR